MAKSVKTSKKETATDKIAKIQDRLTELTSKRYSYSIFASKTIQKHGVALINIKTQEDLVRVFDYIKGFFGRQTESTTTSSELGFEPTETEAPKFFNGSTLEEITADFKVKAEEIRDAQKIAKLEEALNELPNFVSEKEKQALAFAKFDDLLD